MPIFASFQYVYPQEIVLRSSLANVHDAENLRSISGCSNSGGMRKYDMMLTSLLLIFSPSQRSELEISPLRKRLQRFSASSRRVGSSTACTLLAPRSVRDDSCFPFPSVDVFLYSLKFLLFLLSSFFSAANNVRKKSQKALGMKSWRSSARLTPLFTVAVFSVCSHLCVLDQGMDSLFWPSFSTIQY